MGKSLALALLFMIIFSTAGASAQDYAVIVSTNETEGDDIWLNSEYWYDLMTCYRALYDSGYSHDRIIVLYGNGDDFISEYSQYQNDYPGLTSISDANASKMSIINTFEDLAATSPATLLVLWSGHGSRDGDNVRFATTSEPMMDNEFASLIEGLPNTQTRIIVDTCFSGRLINDIQALDNASNIICMTAASPDEFSSSITYGDNYHHEFTSQIFKSVMPRILGYKSGSFPADTDGDGLVSVEEAFGQASEDAMISTPVICDVGNNSTSWPLVPRTVSLSDFDSYPLASIADQHIEIEVTNHSSSTLTNVVCTLSDEFNDPDLVLVDGTETIAFLAPGASATLGRAFRIQYTGMGAPRRLAGLRIEFSTDAERIGGNCLYVPISDVNYEGTPVRDISYSKTWSDEVSINRILTSRLYGLAANGHMVYAPLQLQLYSGQIPPPGQTMMPVLPLSRDLSKVEIIDTVLGTKRYEPLPSDTQRGFVADYSNPKGPRFFTIDPNSQELVILSKHMGETARVSFGSLHARSLAYDSLHHHLWVSTVYNQLYEFLVIDFPTPKLVLLQSSIYLPGCSISDLTYCPTSNELLCVDSHYKKVFRVLDTDPSFNGFGKQPGLVSNGSFDIVCTPKPLGIAYNSEGKSVFVLRGDIRPFAIDEYEIPGLKANKSKDLSSIPESSIGVTCHPNPFNPMTTVSYRVPAGGGEVDVSIYNAQGHLIRRLESGQFPAGVREIPWNGTDNTGRTSPTGVYFCRIRVNDQVQARSMTLLK